MKLSEKKKEFTLFLTQKVKEMGLSNLMDEQLTFLADCSKITLKGMKYAKEEVDEGVKWDYIRQTLILEIKGVKKEFILHIYEYSNNIVFEDGYYTDYDDSRAKLNLEHTIRDTEKLALIKFLEKIDYCQFIYDTIHFPASRHLNYSRK